MRPIRRNASPIKGTYQKYTDAKIALLDRIGAGKLNNEAHVFYCSYCERVTPAAGLAIEHIEPKGGKYGQVHLQNTWHNFLLACANCNSSKGSKQVKIKDLFLPDRDNTFTALQYLADGNIIPAPHLSLENKKKAHATLSLVGLKTPSLPQPDRTHKRIQVWGSATAALNDYISNPSNKAIKKFILKLMIHEGGFSIWMTVFKDYPEMKKLFINSISGTRESGCFNSHTDMPISPHPNKDNLKYGGKI